MYSLCCINTIYIIKIITITINMMTITIITIITITITINNFLTMFTKMIPTINFTIKLLLIILIIISYFLCINRNII